MGSFRLTVVGNTFKDLRCQLQAAIDEIEEENDSDSDADYTQRQVTHDDGLRALKQLNQSLPPVEKIIAQEAEKTMTSIPTFNQIVEKAEKVKISEGLPVRQPTGPAPETDSRGIKWDSRVHASTKEITEKGVWRKRRGITAQELYAAESQQGVVAPKPMVEQPVAAPPIPNFAPAQPQVVYQSPVFVAGQPLPVEPPPVASPVKEYSEPISIPSGDRKQAHDLASFKATLPQSLAKLINEKKINQEYISQLNTHFGVDQLWKINDVQLADLFKTFVDSGLITDVSRH